MTPSAPRTLVTGGAGYIGTHVVLGLLRAGHEVHVIDDFCNAWPDMLEQVRGIAGREFGFNEADIRETAILDRAFGGFRPDAVVHLAGLKSVPESIREPERYAAVNIGGAEALLSAMDAHGCTRIVFSSTAAVYADATGRANRETDPVAPATPYAKTKRAIEERLDRWCAQSPDRFATSLRYFNPAGADASARIGENPRTPQHNLMPIIVDAALGRRECVTVFGDTYDTPDGSGMRDFVHVSDLADAHIAALGNASPGHRIYNVGTGQGITVLGLIRAFEAATGAKVPHTIGPARAGDIGVSVADPARINSELGWTAKLAPADICRSAWAWAAQQEEGIKA
ncbi:MAG: UDP-glucose 4-epimerase GalE [Caulobacterales bacterium]|uniref:UDP-glucose 4-epimerase GalE n=1 Tax=Glycocaulis sp. TaxID=1969725 RepID=UPI003FA0D803